MVDESEDAAIEEGANAEATEKAETTEIDETIEADESADGPCQKCPDGDDLGLVEVLFKGNRRAVFANTGGVETAGRRHVIVEADKGEDIGRIGLVGCCENKKQKGKRKKILRLASDQEIERRKQLHPREVEALADFRARIVRREMPMKAVDVEYQLDGKKICFYFTADHRVDFRELVRELASVYRTRIELRQIGVRDEARHLGGVGPCGRELCCEKFIAEFAPISTQMARDQNLSLNPSKLSGLCGRLKCCLRFEHDFYRGVRARCPNARR